MDLRTKQRAVVDALEDIKGRDIVVYNTASMPSMFERIVIASGDSTRQVKALADHVQEKLKALGARVYGVEGQKSSEWILVDLGDLVVHIMHPTVRSFYNLEEIWGGRSVSVGLGSRKPVRKAAAKAAKKPAAPTKKRAKAKARAKTPRPRRRG
jgi:ribosome-associated protein